MPFSGPSSYLQTIDEFIGHWLDCNLELGIPPLTLPGPYAVANLQTDRTALSDEITDLVEIINDLEGFRTSRNNSKVAIKERMRQLGAFIRGVLAGSDYVGRIPELIDLLANQGKWIISMRDHRNVWTDINAAPPPGFTPPLILTGAYTLAMFTTDTTALETTFTNLTQADQDVDKEIKERDAIYLKIRGQLVRYRDAVEGRFPADHPLVLSIPRLDPLPGHTPDPVILTGAWNAGTSMADFSWPASSDPDLAGYDLRRDAPPYNGNTEQAVITLPPGTLTVSTDEGLGAPGAEMAYKLYVRLTTGNEAGSNAVTILRP